MIPLLLCEMDNNSNNPGGERIKILHEIKIIFAMLIT